MPRDYGDAVRLRRRTGRRLRFRVVRERYVVTNGIRLFAVEEGEGPLVLLVHGFPEFWWSWRHQLTPLAEAGYRVVAVDLPGYGRSDKPDVRYTEQWVNACLEGVAAALGHEQCVIVGHDWGGLLVWPFARRYPDRLAGVVGVNVPDFPRSPMAPVPLLRAMSPDEPIYIVQFQDYGPAEYFLGGDVWSWLRAMFQGAATHRLECFPDDVVARYVEQFEAAGAVTPPIDYYRNMDANWESQADLPEKISVPALMICATHDPVLPASLADGMEARVPDLHTVVIDESGHWTQQEQPEAFNAALIGWLDTLDRWV
jgi:pimeloyl-ACP methyl ester carboxylesterase